MINNHLLTPQLHRRRPMSPLILLSRSFASPSRHSLTLITIARTLIARINDKHGTSLPTLIVHDAHFLTSW